MHSEGDNPAIVYESGKKKWYRDGVLHRDNGPAILGADNETPDSYYGPWFGEWEEWYRDGALHRDDDLPAVLYADGTKKWYKHGALHRDGDKPAFINGDGTQEWYKNNELYRENGGPQRVLANGSKVYVNTQAEYGGSYLMVGKDGIKSWYENNQLVRTEFPCEADELETIKELKDKVESLNAHMNTLSEQVTELHSLNKELSDYIKSRGRS